VPNPPVGPGRVRARPHDGSGRDRAQTKVITQDEIIYFSVPNFKLGRGMTVSNPLLGMHATAPNPCWAWMRSYSTPCGVRARPPGCVLARPHDGSGHDRAQPLLGLDVSNLVLGEGPNPLLSSDTTVSDHSWV
jgi:hypothetical protein